MNILSEAYFKELLSNISNFFSVAMILKTAYKLKPTIIVNNLS